MFPQGPGCPHGAQDILTAPCTCADACNTEPASGLEASCLEKHLPIPKGPGRSSTAQRLQEYVFFSLQEKVAFGPRVEDFGYLPSLSTPSVKFSRIFSKAFEKLQFPQTSYFSALKGSTSVAKGKYINIRVCVYVCIYKCRFSLCVYMAEPGTSPSVNNFFFFSHEKNPGNPTSCPKSMVLSKVPIPTL